ncbi:MAG: tetratricopeptide repeat protein [Flavobacteriales bacterium]|nr:tetratricopeptide repeat protein [Flavobacteriales bacterium]
MRCFAFCCLIALSALPVHGQEVNDSLYRVWQDPGLPDTVRAKALDRHFDAFEYVDRDSALRIADELIRFCEVRDYVQGVAWGHNDRGLALYHLGELESAAAAFGSALEIQTGIGNEKGVSAALNNLGMVYLAQGDRPRALDHYIRSLKMDEALGDSLGVAGSHLNIGVIFLEMGDTEQALAYFLPGLVMMEKLGNPRGIAFLTNSIGNVYSRQGDHAKSLGYFKRSLAILEEHNPNGMAPMLNNVGATFLKLGELDSAYAYLEHSRVLSDEMGDLATATHARIYLGQLALARHDPGLAVERCSKALELGRSLGAWQYHQGACNCLYQAYKDLGEHGRALEYHELEVAYTDSLSNEKNTKKITELEMQYGFEKKEAAAQAEQEKKDAIAAEELQRQKLVRNGFMGGFVLVALFAGVFLTQRNRIGKEKKRSEELLLNILPEEVAEELKDKGEAEAKLIDEVTVLFTDFKGFTAMSETLRPKELVRDLHECFSAFDHICQEHGLEKIKTIGDAYMAAGGLPTPNTTHAMDVIQAALEMRDFIVEGKARKLAAGLPYFEVRIGVHTGPVVAGIVGVKKFQYDIWGDTVNTASRMESSGDVGQVNISEATYALVKDQAGLAFTPRGKVQAKGKGELEMYFVSPIG